MKKLRFVMLFFCSAITIGPYFCYDFPGSLENEIESKFNVDSVAYNTLYSFYATPNIVLPLFGGILFDKIGTHYGILLFAFLMTVG